MIKRITVIFKLFKPIFSIAGLLTVAMLLSNCISRKTGRSAHPYQRLVIESLRTKILADGAWALSQEPETVTSFSSVRSAGTKHDFFSEGDYWWPNPQQPNGPYIQKDGLSNPANFVAHRLAMIRFSHIIGALASAYKFSGDEKYVKQAARHLQAWFMDKQTRMNPHLRYAQAIMGLHTGRGIGIIDTLHLLDVAQGMMLLQQSAAMDSSTVQGVKAWFASYLEWMTTHPYGIAERDAKNNHGTCWTLQVATFAKLTANTALLDYCRNRYKTVLLPQQMDIDGSFPLELKRTKPYGYALFNLEAMASLCQIASTEQDNLWNFQTKDGKSIEKGIRYMYPYVLDKSKWPFPQDVMYWEHWPVAPVAFVFASIAFNQSIWMKTWQQLEHAPQEAEVIRNQPIKYPYIWI